MRARAALLPFLTLLLLCGWPGTPVFGRSGPKSTSDPLLYRYRMKGKVRLLLFWVGKDDVGGGTISVRKELSDDGQSWRQQIEVLFGSNPERVPGRVNRWGYGREWALWRSSPTDGAKLQETVFEGFMKRSKEDSISQVRANERVQESGSNYQYEGIRSRVTPTEASSEIRFFSTREDFDFRNAQPIHCGYKRRVESGPPDRLKQLSNEGQTYGPPFGFLSAVHSLMEVVSEASRNNKTWTDLRPSALYVYNAKRYRLQIEELKHLKTFELPLGKPPTEGGNAFETFSEVAKAEFRLTNLESGDEHDFTLWFPLEGPYRSIPVRIVDKPRWWLRIELNLEPGSSTGETPDAVPSLPCDEASPGH